MTATTTLPTSHNEVLNTPHGPALGTSYRWPGGQYSRFTPVAASWAAEFTTYT